MLSLSFMVVAFNLHWCIPQSLYLASGKTVHNNALNPFETYSMLIGMGFIFSSSNSPMSPFYCGVLVALVTTVL